jgi:hypothetical protein
MTLVYSYPQIYYQWLYWIYFVFLLQNLLYAIDYMLLKMRTFGFFCTVNEIFCVDISTN